MWEDGDKSHTTKEIRDWKQKLGIVSLINAHNCPETNPIKDRAVAAATKLHVRKHAHWSLGQLRGLAEEGWDGVEVKNITRIYEDMPQRWADIANAEGRRINR